MIDRPSPPPGIVTEPLDGLLSAKRDRLLEVLRGYGSVAVAFSGGVDSTVVAKAAQLALGERAVAVTAVSASLASGERQEAEELARLIGIRHRIVQTDEFADPNYVRNAPDRCYYCKSELYGRLRGMARELGVAWIASGANTDDRGDYRPGMKAAGEWDVRHPLQEADCTKHDVRALARHWGLPTWDKPATPCLSSRIAYGEEVTPARVQMIDAAERLLHRWGFPLVRVRYHKGDMARIEVPADQIARLLEPGLRTTLAAELKALGFKFVSLDLEGFRSGSLNAILPVEQLRIIRRADDCPDPASAEPRADGRR